MKRFDFWFPKHESVHAKKGHRLMVRLGNRTITGGYELVAVTKTCAALYDARGKALYFPYVAQLVCIQEYKQGKTPKR